MGIRIPLTAESHVRGVRIATPSCALVRNDMVFSRSAVGLFSRFPLHFYRFCGILGVFNLVLKEFSPWKP